MTIKYDIEVKCSNISANLETFISNYLYDFSVGKLQVSKFQALDCGLKRGNLSR